MTVTLKKTLATLATTALALGLVSCGSDTEDTTNANGITTITVGSLPVPAGDMLKFVDDNLAADAGIDIEWVEFNDYSTPNPALSDGTLDANLFQHQDFLDTYNEQTGGDLMSIGQIYLPAGAYHSEQYDSIEDLPEGASIAIPNDPSNEGRALELLAASGAIEIEEGTTTLDGITSNPKNFTFVEVENATLPMALRDNDAAFVTSSFAIPAGLTQETLILSEEEGSKYYNVLAVRPENQNDEAIQTLKELLLSDETADFINETWSGLILPTSQ